MDTWTKRLYDSSIREPSKIIAWDFTLIQLGPDWLMTQKLNQSES